IRFNVADRKTGVTVEKSLDFNIKIKDINDNSPEFPKKEFNVTMKENHNRDEPVFHVTAFDKDEEGIGNSRIVRGNEEENFIIQTDPDTNEGILSIVKPQTYDGTSERKLVISVENEEALFTCHRGLMRNPSISFNNVIVSINVAARNSAPQFTAPVLLLRQEEEVLPGTFLVQYSARDPDIPPNAIRYKVASDPNGWVTINENSGTVTMRKKVDKDALDWKNSVYPIVIHAIDDGLPPLTGTGTIQLHVSHTNDNPLRLVTSFLEICEGKENGPFRIQVEDRDSHPFAEPFIFELDEALENVKSFWKLGEHFGDSVELLTVKSLPLGDYLVPLEIFNQQGLSRKQTLKVTVCRCLNGITCEPRASPIVGSLGLGGLAAILLESFLLLLLVVSLVLWRYRSQLNLRLLVPAKLSFEGSRKGPPCIPYEEGNQSLIHYSEESQPALPRPGPVYPPAPKRKEPLDTIVETVGEILNQVRTR
ncbi:hypothetical protein lerEdw1_005113, partial [Lerista edwardsae]